MALRDDPPDGMPPLGRTLGSAHVVAGAIVVVLLTILWLGAAACGENRGPLAAQRCNSVFYSDLLPASGFLILAGGLWLAKRTAARWPASIGSTLALVPGILAWRLLVE